MKIIKVKDFAVYFRTYFILTDQLNTMTNPVMRKNYDIMPLFSDLPEREKIAVCFLAVNIDKLRRNEFINCLREYNKIISSLFLSSEEIELEIQGLLDKRFIIEDEKGLYCANSIRQAALLKALTDNYFEDIALLLQSEAPAGGLEGDINPENFNKGLRDLQIAIFRNSPIENISGLILDLCQQFPEECKKNSPLFFLLNNPFSPELLQKIPSFNRILLLGTMISQAEENLASVNHILDYWCSLYLEDEFEIPVTDLLSALFIRGRFQEVDTIINSGNPDKKILPAAYLELYRGCLALIRGSYNDAIAYFEQGLDEKLENFPEGYPGILIILSFLKDGSPEKLQEGLSYIEMLEQKKYFNYYRCYHNLKEVFHDQLGLPAPGGRFSFGDPARFPVKKILPGRHKSLLEEFFYILTLWWIDQEAARENKVKLEIIKEKSVEGEYLWLAAESAGLLAAFDQQREKNEGFARLTHEKLGSVSIINFVREVPHWEKTLKALLHLKPTGKKGEALGQDRKRLVWWFRYNDYDKSCLLQPRLQKSTKSGRWSKGRPLSLKQLYTECHSLEGLSEQDLRICRTISETAGPGGSRDYHGSRTNYRFNYNDTLPALIGHPLIFLDDSPDVRIDLVAGEPEVRVIKTGKKTNLSIEPGPASGSDNDIQIIRDNPTRFKVIRFNEEQRSVQNIIGRGVTFPENSDASLQEALTSISGIVTIQSDLGFIGGEIRKVETDSRPHIQLIPFKEGLKLEILVKPVAGANAWFRPGKDGLNVMAEVGKVRVQARRNLGKESLLTRQLLDCCPTLRRKLNSSEAEEVLVNDPEECLEILQELNECKENIVLEWPEGEKFSLKKHIVNSDLSLHIRKDRNWFKATGSLEVDENFSLELSDLMDRLERSKGRFVPLDDGSFLALTREFHKRLEELKAYSSKSGGGIKFHPLATPALTDLTSESGSLDSDSSWKRQVQRFKEVIEPEVPETLKADLRDYQEEGFKWLAQLSYWGVGACLADDMGLGKTIQALAAVLLRAPKGPTLVVAPLSVINNWKDEAQRFAPALNAKIFGQGDRQKLLDQLETFDLVLISYGLLQVEIDRLTQVNWQTVILDEAQAIKNRRTKRSRAAMALKAEFKVITTGTPVENHPGEIWTLFNFINPGLLGNYKHFHDNFAFPVERGQDKAASERLRKLIKPFILRRLKNEVLRELPPRTDVTLEVEMSKQESALYATQRLKSLDNLQDTARDDRHFRILTEITRLRRLCCNPSLVWPDTNIAGSKLKVFGDTLNELLDNSHKVLVFSQFVDHLKIIKNYLKSLDIEYQYLDGSTSPPQREKSIKNFQAGQGDVFLISLKAGGFGLNLSAADYVIHMDPWWNPAVEDQASDRAHRLGQQKPVTVYRLVMKNSIEEQIVELHTKKRELADSLLEGSDVAGRLSTDQLLELLKG